jgi:MFS transporter, putative metabolite:H+ symporter
MAQAADITARLDRLPMTWHLWKLVTLIAVGGFFEVYEIYLSAYVAPGLIADKLVTATTDSFFGFSGFAAFIAALFIGLFIGTIAVSFLTDRFGRRAMFTWSLLFYSACAVVMAFQDSAFGLNLWRLLGGIAVGVEAVTIDAYISELTPKSSRGRAFAFMQGIGFLSVPVVALLAWQLVPHAPLQWSGWRWVVLIGAAGALVIWFIRLQLPESPRWLALHGRAREAEHVIAAIEARVQADYGQPLPHIRPGPIELPNAGSYLEVFGAQFRLRTAILILCNIGTTVGVYGFTNWVPTLLIAKGIQVTRSLEYTFVIAFAYSIFAAINLAFADRIERKWQIVMAALGIALCGLAFSLQTSPLALIALGACQTMLITWISIAVHAYMAEIYPTRIRARAVGFVYSWSRFAAIFTGFIVAYVLKTDGVTGVFVVVAGAMVVVALAIGLFGPRTNQLALEEISR